MPIITHKTIIEAPIEICFDIARNVDIHTQTVSKTKEKAVAGVTGGLLENGDEVTWEAVHFGIRQRLTAKIIHMDRPNKFTDIMIKGAFKSFTYTHEFKEGDEKTVMIDTFEYESPLGIIGKLANRLFLEKYMSEFIYSRSLELKRIAEKKL